MIGKLPQVFNTETSYNQCGNNNCVNSSTRKCTLFPGTESQIKESIPISHLLSSFFSHLALFPSGIILITKIAQL